MQPKLSLRIAAGLVLIHASLHTLGHTGWRKNPDSVYQGVVKQMTENKFPFMGVSRSVSEYYNGYGYFVTIALVLMTFLLWLVSNALSQNSSLVKNILIAIGLALLAIGIDELIFFFPFAAFISLLASAFTLISVFRFNYYQKPK